MTLTINKWGGHYRSPRVVSAHTLNNASLQQCTVCLYHSSSYLVEKKHQ